MSRAKIKTDPITAEDIKRFLETTDDFQLEIDVFRICREAGFQATHGGSYRDPNTGLNRQYDIRAHYSEESRHVRLAIECKNLGAHNPLLLSTIPRRPSEAKFHGLISAAGSGGGRYAIHEFNSFLFQRGEPVGKATANVGIKRSDNNEFVSNDGDVYEKWAQAIASCHDLVGETLDDWKTSKRKWSAGTVLPILVLGDDALWVANYDENGNLTGEPERKNRCSLYLNMIDTRPGQFIDFPISHLLVCTKSGLKQFFNEFRNHGMVRDDLMIGYKEAEDIVMSKFGDLARTS